MTDTNLDAARLHGEDSATLREDIRRTIQMIDNLDEYNDRLAEMYEEQGRMLRALEDENQALRSALDERVVQ